MSENKSYGLDDWIHHPDVHITINKSPQETQEDAKLRRFKDKSLLIATLIAFAIMYVVCIVIMVLLPNSSYVGTALNGVIGLTLALAGYYVRGKTH